MARKQEQQRDGHRILGRSGNFWHREHYDKLIRNAEELRRVIRYVVSIPEKAGMNEWPCEFTALQIHSFESVGSRKRVMRVSSNAGLRTGCGGGF